MIDSDSAVKPWPAPAKLNLFLHVVGRRADGYHLLQTLFQFIDFQDDVYIAPRADGRVLCHHRIAGVEPCDDLSYRAARLLQREGALRRGADISVVKRLPLGGGLGGGSSDAATVLVALNRLWGLGWGTERLMALGLRIGADVPVFVQGRAAWAEGIGEHLTAVQPAERWYLLVMPAVTVRTAAVFGDPRLTRDTPVIKIRDLSCVETRNDCEPVVRRQYPEVARALNWLGQFAQARLTGTGSCCYAAFARRNEACAARQQVPRPWVGHVVRGLNRSPLLSRLEQTV